MSENAHEELAGLIKKFRFAMVTTTEADGKLVAHPLTVQEAEFDGDLWFIVGTGTSAAVNVAREPRVNVSLSSDDTWVSLSGTAAMVDDHGKLEQLWSPAVDAWFEGGPEDPAAGLLRFRADSAEYWTAPGGKIVRAVAALTGHRVEGENETVEL
ncbi:pyridoxamine 5'-phosphate oxidase family protein [Microbacterium sp. Clip185]|uniref:pyridoxamine 5'-phosphate oxidase family protein n=1 Tax=Microbacterium sp. Clip185 TaxID=3025663 RepID=UPI002365340E|nr:pyridoxamine 5'-phosphate oxidase family protein [Microbacterium sp. Clip185]WDG18770.1 pyridoxamine 5'-phosphate oxidase family protein [Microbacterium sp. Clip185]